VNVKFSQSLPSVKRNPGNICTSLHAEENVCRCLPYNFKNKNKKKSNYDIIVVRYDHSTFKLTESRPCKRCIKILQNHKINNVYYSTRKSDIVREKVENMKQSSGHVTSGMKKFKANNPSKK